MKNLLWRHTSAAVALMAYWRGVADVREDIIKSGVIWLHCGPLESITPAVEHRC
jgi:hypothetical protein